MTANMKPSGTAKAFPIGLGIGLAAASVITLSGCCVLTILLRSGALLWDKIGYGVMGILYAASFAGAAISAGQIKHQRLLVCILSGMIYMIALLMTTSLAFGGQFQAVGVTGGIVTAGALCAALVHSAEKKQKGKSRKKRRL